METNKFIFSPSCRFELATNIFINVPILLRYENINLIEFIKDTGVEFTLAIPIFHSDGTQLAVAKGNRIFKTEEGKKAGIEIQKYPNLWVCTMEGKTIFEIKQNAPDFFKTTAELYTPDGYFLKVLDSPTPYLIDINGESIKIGGTTMSGNIIANSPIGIWVRKNGGISMG